MSKPKPKGNFLQSFIIITTLYLGFYLFIIKPQQDKDQGQTPPTLDAMRQVLITDNKKFLDSTIVHDAGAYTGRLSDEVKKKTITQADADQKRLESVILVADTQRKAGLQRKDNNRLRLAYQTLTNVRHEFQDTPAWQATFDVPDEPQFNTTAWTPAALFQTVHDELSATNQTDMTYGIFPGYKVIDALVALTGSNPGFSYAFACFLLAFLVRAAVYPLSEKQLKFSRQMQQLAPLTNEVRKEYKDDQQTQQVKVMEIYKEYGINPLAGCFPSLLQFPLFITVYQFMQHYQFAFQKGTFLWINADTAKLTHGWTGPNLGEQDYPLIVLYGITMLVSTLLAPISDPSQVKQQRMMTLSITLMFTVGMFFYQLPSAFLLYWTFTNILSTIQSLRAYRRPMPPLEKVNAAGGGLHPKSPVGGKWMKMMEEMQKQAETQRSADGKGTSKPGSGQVISNGEVKTGKPVKHKPKKRN